MPWYRVVIDRVEYRQAVITFKALDSEQAREAVLEVARDCDYRLVSAEETVVSVRGVGPEQEVTSSSPAGGEP